MKLDVILERNIYIRVLLIVELRIAYFCNKYVLGALDKQPSLSLCELSSAISIQELMRYPNAT